MSFVYRAEDMQTGDTVAVKVLKEEFSYDSEFINRFRNEAAAAQKLDHPNIVAIYDLKNDGDIQYIVMEYIDGLTLDKLIKAKKKIPWRNTLKITAQILSAVEHAHSHNIIHRDIKPLNIMITDEGVVKLTDFGIARVVSSATKSAANDSAGSVHYLSPEQIRGGFVDERSDIYSIGITMYEMITGSVPYDGDTHVSIALKHIDGKIVPPCEVDPTVPYGVSDLIVTATRKETNMRFQSAGEMYDQLVKVSKNPYVSFLSEYENYSAQDIEEDTGLSDESGDMIREDNEKKEKGNMAVNVVLQTVTYLAAVIFSILVLMFLVSQSKLIRSSFVNYTVVKYKIGDYKGMQASSVFDAMAGTDIKIEQETVVTEDYPAGYVLEQSVKPGEYVEKEDTIRISVSTHEGAIILDDFTNQSFKVVETQLKNQDIKVVTKEVYSSKYGNGKIVRTSPGAGSMLEKGDEVTIYYSQGNLYKKTVVPNVVGMTLEAARQELSKVNVGLEVGLIYPSPSAPVDGLIVTPMPSPGATVSPTPSQTPTAEPSATPEPTLAPTEEPSDSPDPDATGEADGSADPDVTPDNENGDDEGTPAEETPTEMPTPTETPTPTQTPTPTPTPTPTVQYASDKVVSQYPVAGTEIMPGEKVNLFFYDVSKITPRKKLTFGFPGTDQIKGAACYLRIEAQMTDFYNPAEIVYMDPAVPVNKFPVEFDVPMSLNGAPTKVFIYIGEQGGTPKLYKTMNVYG